MARLGTSAALVSLALVATGLATTGGAAAGSAGPDGTTAAARPVARAPLPPKTATSKGRGGAVSSVDPDASRIGLKVLKKGGNAVDAAIATAAALGLTEPYSSGIGGGGYFLSYNAKSGKVRTIDGRETAPTRMPHDAFIDPETGDPYPFTPELVTSGVSVGVPGTLATWQQALDRWGSISLKKALKPATKLARKGFVVDETFRQQTEDNQDRLGAFKPSRKLFLKGGLPKVGSRFRNKDLAATYDLLARKGLKPFYRGHLAKQIAKAVRKPPKTRKTTLPVPKGYMRPSDLRRYEALKQRPTKVSYRGHQVFGMRPSSSGGSTVGEALNILESFDLGSMSNQDRLHHYLEASALAFADRGAYLGDTAFVDVPLADLLSNRFGRERACRIQDGTALAKPTTAGDVTSYDGVCDEPPATKDPAEDTESTSTTNLTVADRHGNVVEYTLTIEQIAGSGITVPGRGFLLNNELTDFSAVFDADDPNRIQPGKRPRSSMSPTIVLKKHKPFLALGSPGGSTIITTVLQMLVNRIDAGMGVPRMIAAPRASQRNTAEVSAEPAFIDRYGPMLESYGHAFTSTPELGAATAIGFKGRHGLVAVSEPVRRGGGSALVVHKR